jgi:hypothetical protein
MHYVMLKSFNKYRGKEKGVRKRLLVLERRKMKKLTHEEFLALPVLQRMCRSEVLVESSEGSIWLPSSSERQSR